MAEVKLPYAGTAAESVKLIPMNPNDTYGIVVDPAKEVNDAACIKEAEKYCYSDGKDLGVNVKTGRSKNARFAGDR